MIRQQQITFLLLTALIVVISAPATQAQEASPTPTSALRVDPAQRAELRAIREQARQDVKETRAEARVILRAQQREHFAAQIDRRNAVLVKRCNVILDALRRILGKIGVQANTIEAIGADVTAVRAAIVSAEGVINEAAAAITVQSQKTYVAVDAEVSKEELQALFAQFRADQFALRDGPMRAAREAVHAAFAALRVASTALSPSPSPSPITTPVPAS